MTDAAAPAAAAAKPKVVKPKKPAAHPAFGEMIAKAIVGLADKKGSSKVAIKKYILANFKVEDNKKTNTNLNLALKKSVSGGKLSTAKGHSGTFKATKVEKPKKVKTSPKKAAKKPAAKKSPKKVAKKSAVKKSVKKVAPEPTKAVTAKKAVSAKKAVKPKAAKLKKSPTKKAAKPKAVKKTPAKKPVAKKPAVKKAAPKKK
jgi:histone H1/5